MNVASISKASLSEIKTVFMGLSMPEVVPEGFYRAQFIGPWWLRYSAGPSLAISGLRGWQGKTFFADGSATNILKRGQKTQEKLTMRLESIVSTIDAKDGIALRYGQDATLPWCWVSDEIRVLNEHTFLCMTVIHFSIFDRLAFPFLLIKAE